jgi:hypothetical protein
LLPAPAGASSTSLNTVTCSSSAICIAGGSDYTNGGFGFAEVENLSGGAWSPTTGLDGGNSSTLISVACMTSSSCVALGYDYSTSPMGQLALTLGGGSWAPTTVSLPTGSNGGLLTAASCLSSCTGVGWDQQSWGQLPGYPASLPMVATFG